MKKNLLILFLILMQTGYLFAQNINDQTAMLQLCIDLSELQNFYQGNTIYVLQNGTLNHDQLKLSKESNPVQFIKQSEIDDQGVNSFFMFTDIQVENNNGFLRGKYIFNYSGNISNLISFEIDLQKADGQWSVGKASIKQF